VPSSTGAGEEVYLALGSNLGPRMEYLQLAVSVLQDQVFETPVECSGVYETAPVGYLQQPDFLNMVMRGRTSLSPLALLKKIHEIEQILGRKREIRFGPRTIDLDILFYGNQYICYRILQIPHPRMWERAFVLVPLAELTPGRRGLGGKTVDALASRTSGKGEVKHVGYICKEAARLSKIETLDAGGVGRTPGR